MKNGALGAIRLLVHRYEHEGVVYYELLESEIFSYSFLFKNIAKSRSHDDWISEMISDGDYTDQYDDIFKDIKEKEFIAEIMAELHCECGYSGWEYQEYYEESWIENEKFHILSEKDVKEYEDLQKPYVPKPDIVFKENGEMEDWPDNIEEGSNSDLDTRIFFKDK